MSFGKTTSNVSGLNETRSLKLLVRIRPAQGQAAADFRAVLVDLEDRFLARRVSTGEDPSNNIYTVIVSLWSNKRDLLVTTLNQHGYAIKDETEL